MVTTTYSAALIGVHATRITIETEISQGMSAWHMVGLPDASVQEARSRIRSALKESGLNFPYNFRITTNLAPAEIKKSGTAFDLAIAIGIAAKQLNLPPQHSSLFVGELGLDGAVRPVRGVLAIAEEARACGITTIFVPAKNAEEAALVRDISVYAIDTLKMLVQHLTGLHRLTPFVTSNLYIKPVAYEHTFEQIAGNAFAKRALEIAAAGRQHILLSGPPGTGKTMLAHALPSILPPLSYEESLVITKIYSSVGMSPEITFPLHTPPFRAPHHTITPAALIGGGTPLRPGELTLAHQGVLFLDEFPEFSREALEQLREPLEAGSILIHRAGNAVQFPTNCLVVAAQNPCPCGYATHPHKQCRCTGNDLRKYQHKLSGPLLDRFALFCEVTPLETRVIMDLPREEKSAVIQQRVIAARALLETTKSKNAFSLCTAEGKKLLEQATNALHISSRGLYKTAAVAQTIAALSQSETFGQTEITEALQYRQLT